MKPSTLDPRPSPKAPDRLGDAIRELARAMAENGKARMELHVLSGGKRAIYEVRLLRTVDRAKREFWPRPPRGAGDQIIEVAAYNSKE